MPIRINLKELFSADDQAITVDKINFNFNKLLDLGIGDQGKRGFSGIEGAAGPSGIIGPEGIRGNAWFVDIGDPGAPSTFPDLLAGDFYLDSQSFAVWQYNGTGWDFLFNLTSIIDNYLSASPSPFSRGLGIGSPNDDRFIVFNRRDDTLFDNTRKSNSTNDILFLCNFDEDTLAATVNSFDYGPVYPTASGTNIGTNDLYTSLLSIYMNHTSTQDTFGRYAIELGALYQDGTDPKLTQINENFKMKFSRITPSVQVGSGHYNIAEFSLDVPSGEPSTSRSVNSAFRFVSSKFDGIALKEGVDVFIGSQYALDELVGTVNTVKADGLLFRNIRESFLNANIGLANDFVINLGDFPLETGYVTNAGTESYFLLDAGAGVAAILADRPVYQDGGNIIQLATTQPRKVDEELSDYGAPSTFRGHVGIASHGNTIYTVSGKPNATEIDGANYGYFNKFTIENPNNPISEFTTTYSRFNGFIGSSIPSISCTSTYSGDTQPLGPGAADIAIAGEYAYVVNSLNSDLTNGNSPNYERTYFQILKLNSFNNIGLTRVSRVGVGETAGSVFGGTDPAELDGAYRIEIQGNHAIIARNALYVGATRTVLGNSAIYNGGIASIDISDSTAPYIEDFANDYLIGTGYDQSAMLDMEIVNDTAICLSWRQTLDANCSWEVRVSTFNVGTPTSIGWQGRGASAIDSGTVSSAGAYSALSKRGAITANEKYIYAGYGDTVQILNLTRPVASGTSPNCIKTYPVLQTITLDFPGGESSYEILDIKQFGNSLYVLATTGSVRFNSYIFKLDISGGFSNTAISTIAATQIYRKFINDITASRFTIIGKHIYLATVNDANSESNATTLVAVDFDGIYSGGAHIESLRSDQLTVTKDANIGGSLNVRSDTNIGGNLKVDGSISFSGGIAVPGLVPIGTVVPFAGAAAPAGWFLCNGSSKSKSIYGDLYSVIQDNYGTFNASTYRIPNIQNKVPVGLGASPFLALGNTGGTGTSVLTVANLPKHTHNAVGDGANINITGGGAHIHKVYDYEVAFDGGGGGDQYQNLDGSQYTVNTLPTAALGGGSHVHINANFAGVVGDGNTQGMASTPITNLQPYIVMNYIIYHGVGG